MVPQSASVNAASTIDRIQANLPPLNNNCALEFFKSRPPLRRVYWETQGPGVYHIETYIEHKNNCIIWISNGITATFDGTVIPSGVVVFCLPGTKHYTQIPPGGRGLCISLPAEIIFNDLGLFHAWPLERQSPVCFACTNPGLYDALLSLWQLYTTDDYGIAFTIIKIISSHLLLSRPILYRDGVFDVIVRRLWIMSHLEVLFNEFPTSPTTMSSIADRLQIPGRTLRNCCYHMLSVSPLSYYRIRRLILAHNALVRENSNLVTVTKIAMDLGFSELGRFAVHYRTMFGESPSVTLRRQARTQTGVASPTYCLFIKEAACAVHSPANAGIQDARRA